jgi:uncharacterized repeat protein (TIGR03803 family)
LLQGSDGNLYGTTWEGGSEYYGGYGGTIFKITPMGTLTTLYSFCAQPSCADGEQPRDRLIQGTDGNFYGTTQICTANPGRRLCIHFLYDHDRVLSAAPFPVVRRLAQIGNQPGSIAQMTTLMLPER